MSARSAKYQNQEHGDLDSTRRIRLHEVASKLGKSKHGICRFVNVEKATLEIVGVLFVALSVLTVQDTLVRAHPRNVKGDNQVRHPQEPSSCSFASRIRKRASF
jgi:hypothetical protein